MGLSRVFESAEDSLRSHFAVTLTLLEPCSVIESSGQQPQRVMTFTHRALIYLGPAAAAAAEGGGVSRMVPLTVDIWRLIFLASAASWCQARS